MAILTNSGRAVAAMAVKAQPIHLAWGGGDPAWDDLPEPPAEEITTETLLNEFGRRRATQVLFCKPDPQGELVVPNGRFSASTEPTKYLYMRFAYDFTDAEGSVIREFAVFVGTTIRPEVPVGKDYVVPSEIQDPGLLLALENSARLVRSSAVRQQFEFVVQF